MKSGFSVTFERYFPHDQGDEVCEADERGFVIENVSLREATESVRDELSRQRCDETEHKRAVATMYRSIV